MVKQQHRKPTKAELEILMILWKHSEAVTVREVFEAVNEQKYASYTTVLKLLQIMHEKGLVERDEQNRAHRYRAKIKQKETGKRMLDEVLQKIFGGSASRLVQQVLEAETTSAEDMREIRKMIEKAEKGAKQK
ncbi:MAG: BlaI/MecI/CopY family transcriptional regulator [Acidobacteria bacterium]|nr:BlaI/MecI/CopY family transcriptional regulator [Acidobacteriota bacterium]